MQEAADLLAKESIAPVEPVKGKFVSSYFAVAKAHSPGKFRPILNLKKFNPSVKKYKFGMEDLLTNYMTGSKRMLGSAVWT